MARTPSKTELSAFDTPQSSTGRYPWAEWTNGEAYVAKKDEDFKGKHESFRYVLRAQATKRNLTVDVRTLADGEIMFRFAKPATETATASETTSKAA